MSKTAVDAKIPAGNTIVKSYDEVSRTFFLEKEFRDTEGNWFYWKFRAIFADSDVNQTFTFRFENGPAIGECGPAFSLDQGKSWQWLGMESVLRDPADMFSFTCKPGMKEVWFCMGIPYLQNDLKVFLDKNPDVERKVLCRTKQNREVELLIIPGGSKKLLLTSRHHACEMMATYVLEGIMDYAVKSEKFRSRYTVYAVPFVDKDGVENGDQGKYRRPHDHNRDYWDTPIYPETAAVMALIRKLKPDVMFDLHCPWLHDVGNPNGTSKLIHYLESENPEMSRTQHRFGELLEQTACPLVFFDNDKLPFGSEWNNKEVITPEKGITFDTWGQETVPEADLVLTMEIPYAKVYETPILAADARNLGHAFADALLRLYQEN